MAEDPALAELRALASDPDPEVSAAARAELRNLGVDVGAHGSAVPPSRAAVAAGRRPSPDLSAELVSTARPQGGSVPRAKVDPATGRTGKGLLPDYFGGIMPIEGPALDPEVIDDDTRKRNSAIVAGGYAAAGAGMVGGPPLMALMSKLPTKLAGAAGLASGTSAVGAGTTEVLEGRNPLPAMADAALMTDIPFTEGDDGRPIRLPTPLLGAGFYLLGEGAALGRNKMHQKFPIIRRYADAVRKRVYDDPSMRVVGREGVHEAGRIARDEILARDAAMAEAESAAYNQGVEALPGMDDMISVAPVHRRLNRSVARFSNDNPVRPKAEAKVEEVKGNLRNPVKQRIVPRTEDELQTNIRPASFEEDVPWRARAIRESDLQTNIRPVERTKTAGGEAVLISRAGPEGRPVVHFEPDPSRPGNQIVAFEPPFVPDPTRPGAHVVRLDPGEVIKGPRATPRDLLMQRRAVKKDAQFGGQETPENLGAREIYFDVDEAVKDAVPGLRPLDEGYTRSARGRARRNDIMKGSEEGGREVQLPEPTREAIAAAEEPIKRTMRVGDEKQMAKTLARMGDDTVEAIAHEPYLKELAAQDPEFAAALERLLQRKDHAATRISLLPSAQSNLSQVTGFAGMLPLARQNATAIGARFVDPALRATSAARASAPYVPFFTDILDAYTRR